MSVLHEFSVVPKRHGKEKMKNQRTKKLVTSAMLIAIATAISVICEYIPFLNLPFGGTITLASTLPVIAISYMYGLRWGFSSAFVYSLIQIAVGTKTVAALFTPADDGSVAFGVAIGVILIDYILAFTCLGIGGIYGKFMSKKKALVLGTVTALVLCYLFHFLSGALYYGAWAEWFFTDTVLADLAVSKYIMENFTGAGLASVYSLVYNGCYMVPEIIITAIVAVPISMIKQVKREI